MKKTGFRITVNGDQTAVRYLQPKAVTKVEGPYNEYDELLDGVTLGETYYYYATLNVDTINPDKITWAVAYDTEEYEEQYKLFSGKDLVENRVRISISIGGSDDIKEKIIDKFRIYAYLGNLPNKEVFAEVEKMKGTHLVFLDKETNKPIYGLSFSIETENGIVEGETNAKGYYTLELEKEDTEPFSLQGEYHKNAKDAMHYKDTYVLGSYEVKEQAFLETLEEETTKEDKKLLLEVKKVKVASGDSLKKYAKKYYKDVTIENNKFPFLADFNWGKSLSNTYRDFDFGDEGEIFIPSIKDEKTGLKVKKTHVFLLSKLEREEKTTKIIRNLLVKKRNIWSNETMDKYDILDPSIINEKRSSIEFDWNYDTIVLHHTGNSGDYDRVNALEKLHIVTRKWEDIAYHFVIGRKDKSESGIYEGRPLTFKGAYAGAKNTKKIGIVLCGDFDNDDTYNPFRSQFLDGEDDFVEVEQMVLLKSLILLLTKEFPIKYLVGHSDVINEPSYKCPGIELHNKLGELRQIYGLQGY